jgi:hypothetical protein
MKLFAYNDKLYNKNEFGSFTIVARQLNKFFLKHGLLGDINDPSTFVVYPDVFETQQRWQRQIPLLACEYSLMPNIVIQKLKTYNPLVLAISDFAKNNIINSGYKNVKTAHLASDKDIWFETGEEKFSKFTYLTINSSNERSGLEELIPAFIEFSKDKDVQLIIKDGKNESFSKYVSSLGCEKIIYIDKPLTEDSIRSLYNKSHLFLYANHTTSFGMNPMDSVLCGTPAVVTFGSALKEFIPEWTQPIKIKTEMKIIDSRAIKEWQSKGINVFPEQFLNLFSCQIYGERVSMQSILESLDYSFINYSLYQDIVKKHKDFVLKNFTWDHTINKIIEEIELYAKMESK